MNAMITELINYRQLLIAFVSRNIKIKYKQTVMGFLWAIFMPAIIVLSGIMVKSAMAFISGKELQISEIASVSVKALPWAFFVGAIKSSTGSLVTNMNLVKKIYFPRAIFPLSYIFGQLFDFMISTVAFSIIFIIADIGISIYILWLPLLIAFLFLLTSGLAMILSCGNLFYRDVRYIVDVIMTFGIFFTPVFYEASMFPKWENVILLNPVGAILENINNVVVFHQAPHYGWLIYSGLISVFGFIGAWYVFQLAEPKFAESI